jgi:dihydropteroate synthase
VGRNLATGAIVSVDTTTSEVARAALDEGAQIVNDVSGLANDPAMAAVVAGSGAALCLMHRRGTPASMQQLAVYEDLLGEVLAELTQALQRAEGIAPEKIALDPGLGFAKTSGHNLLLLRRQRELMQLGRPLVVGPSRKAFIGALTGKPAGERAIGTVAAAVAAAVAGAAVVRVHDVAAVREALAVSDAIRTSAS